MDWSPVRIRALVQIASAFACLRLANVITGLRSTSSVKIEIECSSAICAPVAFPRRPYANPIDGRC